MRLSTGFFLANAFVGHIYKRSKSFNQLAYLTNELRMSVNCSLSLYLFPFILIHSCHSYRITHIYILLYVACNTIPFFTHDYISPVIKLPYLRFLLRHSTVKDVFPFLCVYYKVKFTHIVYPYYVCLLSIDHILSIYCQWCVCTIRL